MYTFPQGNISPARKTISFQDVLEPEQGFPEPCAGGWTGSLLLSLLGRTHSLRRWLCLALQTRDCGDCKLARAIVTPAVVCVRRHAPRIHHIDASPPPPPVKGSPRSGSDSNGCRRTAEPAAAGEVSLPHAAQCREDLRLLSIIVRAEIFICLGEHVSLASGQKMDLLRGFICCSLLSQPNSSQIPSALIREGEGEAHPRSS